MTKLLIFDCGGVLRSASWQGIYQAYLAIGEHQGANLARICPGVPEFKCWFNPDWKQNFQRMGISPEADTASFERIFRRVYDPFVKTFSWLESMVHLLKPESTLAILSGSSRSSIGRSLSGLAGCFSMIVGHEEVTAMKPDPEGLHLIMDTIGARPEDTWMIGDMEVDILAGKKAGTKTAVVPWGLTDSEEELHSFGADRVLEGPEDLILLVD